MMLRSSYIPTIPLLEGGGPPNRYYGPFGYGTVSHEIDYLQSRQGFFVCTSKA